MDFSDEIRIMNKFANSFFNAIHSNFTDLISEKGVIEHSAIDAFTFAGQCDVLLVFYCFLHELEIRDAIGMKQIGNIPFKAAGILIVFIGTELCFMF